jgi:hypothetical protein
MRLISLLTLLSLCGTVWSVSVSQHLVATPLGGIVLVDQSRTTTILTTVKVDRTLFAPDNNRIPVYDASEVENKVQNLLSNAHKRCAKDLGLVANTAKVLPVSEFVHENTEGMKEQESLEKVYTKYLAVFRELFSLKDTKLHALAQPALSKAVRKMVQNYTKNIPQDEEISISLVGCTHEDALILQITLDYVADSDAVKYYEVVDYGRFDESRVAYVRINMAPHWIQMTTGHTKWATVDINQCEQKYESMWSCPNEAVTPTSQCNPQNVDGCTVDVEFVGENAVHQFHLSNGSVVIASNLEKFTIMRNRMDSGSQDMPSSGVIVANTSMHCNFKFGSVKVRGHNVTADCGWSPVKTTSMSFEDARFVDEPSMRMGWAFVLSEKDQQGSILKAIPVGFFYDVLTFAANNVWWLAALSVAVMLSIAITLLFVCCRVRMLSAYQQIRPHLKKSPEADTEKAKPSEEDMESGVGMSVDEFNAERKRRRFPHLHMPNFHLNFGKGSKAVPTEESDVSPTEESRQQQRESLMALLKHLMPTRKAKSVTEESDSDSNHSEELTSVKVVDEVSMGVKQENPIFSLIKKDSNVFDYAQILSQLDTSQEKLNEFRNFAVLRQKRKAFTTTGAELVTINLVTFWKLVKYGSDITEEDNNEMPPMNGLPQHEANRLSYALKALHLQTAVKPNKILRHHHFVRKFPENFMITDNQIGEPLPANEYYKIKYGIHLRYLSLPMVRVAGGRSLVDTFPMELLEVRDDPELVFNSILLARNYSSKINTDAHAVPQDASTQ